MEIKNRPLISVIVPVYNVSKYLDRCIMSIVRQNYKNIEILLIDDGSTDDSGTKCDDWGKKDHRIKVLHKQNGGLSSARNVGICNMTGEYVMFVDSDDIISQDIVSVLYMACIKHNADISICDVVHVFDENIPSFQCEESTIEYTAEDAICEMWYQTSFLPSAWAKLYKREIFQGIRFTEGRLYEDIDIMHEVFWKSQKIVFTDAKLYGYVHREGSITTKAFSKKDLDILIIVKKMMAFVADKSNYLKDAAESYATSAALRVYLNIPKEKMDEFGVALDEAERYLNLYGKCVLKNSRVRKKNKVALFLYMSCKPALRVTYRRINRWK